VAEGRCLAIAQADKLTRGKTKTKTKALIRNQARGNVMRHVTSFLLAGVLALCTVQVADAAKAKVFKLTSSAFKDNGTLKKKNAGNNKSNPNCVGENVSPPLSWKNAPAGTKSFVMLMFDPEGRPPNGVSHWVAYGIPATVTGFAEGEVSKPSNKYVGGQSLMKLGHYFGPCTPPNNDWHHYTFTLMATDLEPGALKPGLTREEVMKEVTGHVKGVAGLIARFRHP
jgi:Raf kinase inhibitor-like YbhB/YbcL family protein